MGKNKKYKEVEEPATFSEMYEEGDVMMKELLHGMDGLPFFGSEYHFDLNAICDFINYADKNEVREISITDVNAENFPYGSDGDTIEGMEDVKKACSKEVKEVRTHSNQQMDTLRYDLFKTMLDYMLNAQGFDTEGSISIPVQWNIATIGNTMIQYGFIKKNK